MWRSSHCSRERDSAARAAPPVSSAWNQLSGLGVEGSSRNENCGKAGNKNVGKCAGDGKGDMVGDDAYGRADNWILGNEGRGARNNVGRVGEGSSGSDSTMYCHCH